MNATDALDSARPLLRGLVQRAERSTGSKMLAYGVVAREIKASASWVRKALGNQPVAFPAHIYMNMVRAYEAACLRLEAEAAAERERFLALGRDNNADAKSVAGSGSTPTGQRPSHQRATSTLVAEMVGEVGR